jgi:predicted phosphodiesterase
VRNNVAEALTRIISDIHYGDRASAVTSLAQLAPLLAGTRTLICNGDTLDTRAGPYPEHTAHLRRDLTRFIQCAPAEVRLFTGNHDPDVSNQASADLAGGHVLVTHGDVLFDNLVPWGVDAMRAGELVSQARAACAAGSLDLARLLQIHRQAAAQIPQRHQAEPRSWKYLAGFLKDTIWPAPRALLILRAWQKTPGLAQSLLKTHRPQARFLVMGHTHRPGIWRRPDGRTIINTGSYCPPSGRLLVELTTHELLVRRVLLRGGDFHPGKIIAQFALTSVPPSAKSSP